MTNAYEFSTVVLLGARLRIFLGAPPSGPSVQASMLKSCMLSHDKLEAAETSGCDATTGAEVAGLAVSTSAMTGAGASTAGGGAWEAAETADGGSGAVGSRVAKRFMKRTAGAAEAKDRPPSLFSASRFPPPTAVWRCTVGNFSS